MNFEIRLVSKLNIEEISNNTNRKNKNRIFYKWTLERFKKNNKGDSEVDIFPTSPEDIQIQKLKENVMFEINSKNIFDFDFTPIEKDFLSIINKKDNNDYLNLIFLDGKWTEEYYIYSKRSFFDIYSEIENGEFELK